MKYTTLNELRVLQNINETNVSKITQILNSKFEKGLISEELCENSFKELDNLIEKAGNHKYFKREGTPGNYKYYYTEAEYKQAKGGDQNITAKHYLGTRGRGMNEVAFFKKDGKVYRDPHPKIDPKNDGPSSLDNLQEVTGSQIPPSFNNPPENKDSSKHISDVSGRGDKSKKDSRGKEIKVGDKIKGTEGVTKDKIGTITSIKDDMAQVDFGNGDKYGITLRRINEGEFKKEN